MIRRVSALCLPLFVTVLAFSCHPALAQDTPERQSRFARAGGFGPGYRVRPNATTDPAVLERRMTGVSVNLPFERVGGIALTGSEGSLESSIISGWRLDDTGVLAKFDPVTLQLSDQKLYPGIDPVDVAFTGIYLVMIERHTLTVRVAAWSPSSPFPDISSFATVRQNVHWPGAAIRTFVENDSVVAHGFLFRRSIKDVYPLFLFKDTDGVWKAESSAADVPGVDSYYVLDGWLQEFDKPVRIRGPIGIARLIRRSSGAIVGSNSLASGEVSITPVAPLELGEAYFVERTDGVGASRDFHPYVRYGQPSHFGQMQFREGYVLGGRAVAGDSEFSIAAMLEFDGPLSADASVFGIAWYNWRDPNGSDPVSPDGILAVGPAPLNFTMDYPHLSSRRTVAVNIPIPASGVTGNVVLFQFAAFTLDQSQFVVSDVFGTEIRPASAGASSPSAPGAPLLGATVIRSPSSLGVSVQNPLVPQEPSAVHEKLKSALFGGR